MPIGPKVKLAPIPYVTAQNKHVINQVIDIQHAIQLINFKFKTMIRTRTCDFG